MNFARGIAEKITQVVMNYSDVEILVRDATNNDPWGPPGSIMQELASHTNKYEGYADVMCMLWRRMLQDIKTDWCRVYKSLVLLSYLLRHGSDKVVASALEHVYDMKYLSNYSCFDEHGKDRGACVRQKVSEILNLLEDQEKLKGIRASSQKNKNNFVGISMEHSLDYSSSWGNYNTSGDHWKARSDSYQASEYKDFDDDNDVDSDLNKYGVNANTPRTISSFSYDGDRSYSNTYPESSKETKLDRSDDNDDGGRGGDDDDDFNPRKAETYMAHLRDDDGFGDYEQYQPNDSYTSDNNNAHMDMLIFDNQDNNNTFTPYNNNIQTTFQSSNNNNIQTTFQPSNNNNNFINNNNNFINNNNNFINNNNLHGIQLIHNLFENITPVPFPISSQGNATSQPAFIPAPFQPSGGIKANNPIPRLLPTTNPGNFHNYRPMGRQGSQLDDHGFQLNGGSLQNVGNSNEYFQSNQKSLI